MSAIITTQNPVPEGGDVVLLARIAGLDDTQILQANVSSVTYETFDAKQSLGSAYTRRQATNTTPASIATATPAVADVILDTYQTSHWVVDTIGYNFRLRVPAASLPTSESSTYPNAFYALVEVKVTMDDGSIIKLHYEIETSPSLLGKL